MSAFARGFTPAPDAIREDIDSTAAYVFGIVWRYCQMRRRVCDAPVERIAARAGYGKTATRDRLAALVEKGWIEAESRAGRPTIYRDAGRWSIFVVGEEVVGEEPLRETEGSGDNPSGKRRGTPPANGGLKERREDEGEGEEEESPPARRRARRRSDRKELPEIRDPERFGSVFAALMTIRKIQSSPDGTYPVSDPTAANTRSLASDLIKLELAWYEDSKIQTRKGVPTVDADLVLEGGRAFYRSVSERTGKPYSRIEPPTVRQLRDHLLAFVGSRTEEAEREPEPAFASGPGIEEEPEEEIAPEVLAGRELWSGAKKRLELATNPATFREWISPTKGVLLEEGVLSVEVPSSRSSDWLVERLGSVVAGVLEKEAGSPVEVRYLPTSGDRISD